MTTRGRLLSVRLTAELLGLGVMALRNAIARKELTVQRHPSGRLAGVYEADAEAWIARRRAPAVVATTPAQSAVDARMQDLLPPKHERVFSH